MWWIEKGTHQLVSSRRHRWWVLRKIFRLIVYGLRDRFLVIGGFVRLMVCTTGRRSTWPHKSSMDAGEPILSLRLCWTKANVETHGNCEMASDWCGMCHQSERDQSLYYSWMVLHWPSSFPRCYSPQGCVWHYTWVMLYRKPAFLHWERVTRSVKYVSDPVSAINHRCWSSLTSKYVHWVLFFPKDAAVDDGSSTNLPRKKALYLHPYPCHQNLALLKKTATL